MASGSTIPSAHRASGLLRSKDLVFGCPVFFETPESSAMVPGSQDSASWLSDRSNLRAFAKWWGLSGGSRGRVSGRGGWHVTHGGCLGNITRLLLGSGPS